MFSPQLNSTFGPTGELTFAWITLHSTNISRQGPTLTAGAALPTGPNGNARRTSSSPTHSKFWRQIFCTVTHQAWRKKQDCRYWENLGKISDLCRNLQNKYRLGRISTLTIVLWRRSRIIWRLIVFLAVIKLREFNWLTIAGLLLIQFISTQNYVCW